MKNTRLFLVLLICVCLWQCKTPASDTPEEKATTYYDSDTAAVKTGGIRIISLETPKGRFNIWTKRYGNNPKTRVLLLQGGPGCSHEYFECFESFFPKEGIEFIYYDQLGCGNSDNPNDTALWDLPRYVEEVEHVRKALALDSSNFFLLGHSWGGILALEYALKYQQHLKGLVISNMMSSAPAYGRYADEVLAQQMDSIVLDSIRRIEASGDFSNPRYMGLLIPHYYEKHVIRMPADSWPDPVKRAFNKLNSSLYVTMQGPSEFGIAGKLAAWDVSGRLSEIKVPTLVIGAQYDTMDPEHMSWMSKQLPKGQYLHCPNGSHMSLYDDQETYMKGVIRFLKTTP